MTDGPRPLPRSAPADPDPMVGHTLVERYRIEGLLARGGMARVYRARDSRLERDVAVKILSPPYADDTDFVARFLGEARAAASLSHPSLVHVYDSGSDGAIHFIVMELLDRHRSLRQELETHGRLPRDQVVRIGQELLAGLRVVHERGLVHCDVKPANVMLGPGPAKLIDFGIARSPHAAERGSTSIGSLHFMSPEQLHGRPLTPASDLFSLAVVLYEALTGRVPYPGRTPEEVAAAQAAGAVRPPSTIADGVPGRLDEAILQALRADPTQRFHGAEAMGRALSAATEEVSRSRNEDTTVVHHVSRAPDRPSTPRSPGGYVPPPAAPEPPARRPERRAPRPAPYAAGPGRSNIWGLLGTLGILAAAALVVGLVIMLITSVEREPGAGGATPTPAPSLEPGMVLVPDTIGMSPEEAVQAARDAGLNWRLNCAHDEARPAGIIDQAPAAGTPVRRGSAFALYSARFPDCQRQY